MKFIRNICRFYLSKFPITEGKKFIFFYAKKYLLPSQINLSSLTKHGFYLKLNLENLEHQYYYFYMSHDERYEVNNLQNIILDTDNCWDVGANIGFYSFLFASIAKNGKVVAFEPILKTFNDLNYGKEKNNYKNLSLKNFALGSECTKQKIYFDKLDHSMGTASFFGSNIFHNSELVDINTIDSICKNICIPDLIKIDVEGFQQEVIKGGESFFKKHSPMVMIEIDKETSQSLEDYFVSLDYQFYKFNKNYLTKVDSIFNNGRNILFVKSQSKYLKRIEGLDYEY